MDSNWLSQTRYYDSVFDLFISWNNAIPESDKANIICPHCQYHTGWRRAPHWVNCGWCFERVPSAEKPITQVIESYLSILGGDSSDRLSKFTSLCAVKDKAEYSDWRSLPLNRLEMLLSKIYLETKKLPLQIPQIAPQKQF